MTETGIVPVFPVSTSWTTRGTLGSAKQSREPRTRNLLFHISDQSDQGERGGDSGFHRLRFYSDHCFRSITLTPTHSSRAWVSHMSV
jgi:hypothetical protein